MVGTGAVPVFFAVGCIGDIAGVECDDLLAAYLDQAAAFGDVQGLPAVVGMPGAARSGRAADRGDVQVRGGQSPGDGVDPHFNPGRIFDFETDLDHVADAYTAMDERRAIKSLIRVGAVR